MKPVVILAGQSDMVGNGQLSELGDITLPINAQLFDLKPRDDCFGPDVGFARRFLELTPLDELWLLAYMRADLGQRRLPFLAGVANPAPARFDHHPTVREAQSQVAQTVPNVSLVETDGLTKYEDEVHCDTAGQLEMGRRFANQLALDLRQKGARGHVLGSRRRVC